MKKRKLLSCLLAGLLTVSAFGVVSVTAADANINPVYCDFEGLPEGANTDAAFAENGVSWVKDNNNGKVGSYNVTIKKDDIHGKALQLTNVVNVGVALDSTVSTGKVRFGFSMKAGTLGYLRGVFDAEKNYKGTFLSQVGTQVSALSQAYDGVIKGGVSLIEGNWYWVEAIVDVDENSWTMYVDGEEINSYTVPETEEGVDPMPTFQGFNFYRGDGGVATSLLDNFTLTYSVASDENAEILSYSDYKDDDGNTVIEVVTSEPLSAETTPDDVYVAKCGSLDTAIVSDVSFLHNKVILTMDGSLDAGCEYCVSFGDNVTTMSGVPVEGYAYAHGGAVGGTVTPYTEKETFDNLNTTTSDSGKVYAADDGVYNILRTDAYYQGTSTSKNCVVTSVDDSKKGSSGASGSAVGLGGWSALRLLDIIPTDYGVETYEFDFRWTHGTSANWFNPKLAEGNNAQVINVGVSQNWKHVKIEYDTVADTIKSYIDGDTAPHKTITGVTTFNEPLTFIPYSSDIVFEIDNYESYISVSSLGIESVRYIDESGYATGANLVSPETVRIDITFSETVDDTTLGGISLTANGESIFFSQPEVAYDVVSLSVPGMFPGSAQLELTLPSEISSKVGGKTLSEDKFYNVETDIGTWSITDLDITVDGDTVSSSGTTGADGAYVLVTGKIINTMAQTKDVTVLYAFYNGGQLVDIYARDISLTETDYKYDILESDWSKANMTYDTVKAFVWDGLDTALAETAAVNYPAN